MARRPTHPNQPTARERHFVTGLVAGKTKKQAALDAGYAASTAQHSATAILQRPLVRSALTQALEAAGVTFGRIIQPYVDGLNAMHVLKNAQTMEATPTNVPDLPTRMVAADRIVDLFGGIPKVSDATPTAHGLVVNFTFATPPPSRQRGVIPPANGQGTGADDDETPAPSGLAVRVHVPTGNGTT